MVGNEPTVSFPPGVTGQPKRRFGRFAWPKEAQGHINPGAPEHGTGRLYQITTKVSFSSAQRECF